MACACALVLAGCTSGNIVTDFQEPEYVLIDRLEGGVEIRRYDDRALVGAEAAEATENADDATPDVILAIAAESGLVAIQGGAEASRQNLLAALEASPKWQAAGDPTVHQKQDVFSFLGRESDVVVVPIDRQSPGFKS